MELAHVKRKNINVRAETKDFNDFNEMLQLAHGRRKQRKTNLERA